MVTNKIFNPSKKGSEFLTRDVKTHPEVWNMKIEKAMEKRLYKTPDVLFCNCGNQYLLMPGCTCDVCMGVAPECSESFPDQSSDLSRDQFDMGYFEALERAFESFEFAA